MEVPSPPFDEVFALAEVIVLGEEPSHSIAEVGEFFGRPNRSDGCAEQGAHLSGPGI